MLRCLRCVFKGRGWLLLIYSSLISVVCLKRSPTKNVRSKRVGGWLEVHSSLISIAWVKCVFKVSERLLFKLFIINQYSMLKMLYYKNMCWNLVGGIFLVFSSLIQSKWGAAFFGLFIINRYCMPKMFYYKFYRTSPNGCFLTCCVLICLSN